MKNTVLSTSSEWTFDLIETYDQEISKIAADFGLQTYPNQIEVISAEQMMDAYASVGMPLNYPHWSFGKQFVNIEKQYRQGQMALAYEIVINSNPCISYLMEESTMTMQALVIAHACYGHNSFFKNNYLFQTWTNADAVIDYLLFAKNYIRACEEKYGIDTVEEVLDSCHALMNYGVDRYKRPSKLSAHKESLRQKERAEYLQSQVNDLWRTLPQHDQAESDESDPHFPAEPQENLLYFLEKNAPLLESWKREVIRIVRKTAQYFYPQKQTKVMNEGWASFWHYTILNTLYDKSLVADEFMLEFLQSHTNVIFQPGFDSSHYSGINPYTLGFAIYSDIRRICEHPTDEDRYWFRDLVDTNWVESLDFAMRNFKDESFIAQYLSPKVIRDLKLFAILDDDRNKNFLVDDIHDEQGYQAIREALSMQNNLSQNEPNIQVYRVDTRGDRSLTLRHYQHQRRPLDKKTAGEVVRHFHRLWGFQVRLEAVNEQGKTNLLCQCP